MKLLKTSESFSPSDQWLTLLEVYSETFESLGNALLNCLVYGRFFDEGVAYRTCIFRISELLQYRLARDADQLWSGSGHYDFLFPSVNPMEIYKAYDSNADFEEALIGNDMDLNYCYSPSTDYWETFELNAYDVCEEDIFNIPMKEDGNADKEAIFDFFTKDTSASLKKILCKRGALDWIIDALSEFLSYYKKDRELLFYQFLNEEYQVYSYSIWGYYATPAMNDFLSHLSEEKWKRIFCDHFPGLQIDSETNTYYILLDKLWDDSGAYSDLWNPENSILFYILDQLVTKTDPSKK